jgi:SIR2-like domain
MPHNIIEELEHGIVFFAGAGISTENKTVFPYTFYEDVRDELGVPSTSLIAFSKIMSDYCSQANGRAKLLQKLQERFNYIRSFPQIYENATRFHRELSTIPQIDTIITTNWDDYFERVCCATPFVTPQDFALWNVPGRKVIKIHGSINNYGSIVLTENDYKACYRRLRDGILGSVIKQIVGTKTIIYVGYSFGDQDFIRIHRLISKEMGTLLPHPYIVTLDNDSNPRFEAMGITPINTDGTHFVKMLKQHLVSDGQMLDDRRFSGVFSRAVRVENEHSKFVKTCDFSKHPEDIYALVYQDGLNHAFERMATLVGSGHYSHICDVQESIRFYSKEREKRIKAKAYDDVAYIDGYINGLVYLLADDDGRKALPLYYVYGAEHLAFSQSDYVQMRKKASKIHKAAYKHAIELSKRYIGGDPNMTLRHTPFLL